LDPTYPADRIEFILEDVQAEIVVTRSAHANHLQNQTLVYVEALDSQSSPLESEEVPHIDPDSLAYIIHTSGSTGRPKGVGVKHSNLFHSTQARFDYYEESPKAFLLLSSFAFDSSIAGIFWTLCSGGNLVIPENRIEQDLEKLAWTIQNSQVTHTLLLPTLFETIIQNIEVEALAFLRTVIVAGEACRRELVKLHFRHLPNTQLYNEYGPTEATVWCTAYQITSDDIGKLIPIGKPISGASIYILDEHLQPVPVGVAGTLYVGGKGLTPGYWNRDDLTQERFIPHPFSSVSNDKLYYTGDLAKYRADGNIDFLGRADQQVKIRGFRIELEEIEHILKSYPQVEDAVVVVQEGKGALEMTQPLDVNTVEDLLEQLPVEEADQLLRAAALLSETLLTDGSE